MKKRDRRSSLFGAACYLMKHFMFGLLGAVMAGIVIAIFGMFHIVTPMISLIMIWLARIGATIFCLLAFGIILESIE
jgi:hypothetical protein